MDDGKNMIQTGPADRELALDSPWFSIWTRPRATIRRIIETDPERCVLWLAALAGIANVLNNASIRSTGDHFSSTTIFIMAAIVGPLSGMVSLYVTAAILRWTGSWIGGTADSRDIRSAIAWSGTITIWAMPLWIPEWIMFGHELFTSATPRMDASAILQMVFLGMMVIELIIGMWNVVVFMKCLGEVQGFSAWKALLNCLLLPLIIVIPLVIIMLLVK